MVATAVDEMESIAGIVVHKTGLKDRDSGKTGRCPCLYRIVGGSYTDAVGY